MFKQIYMKIYMMYALGLLVFFSLLFVFKNILFSTRFCPNKMKSSTTHMYMHVWSRGGPGISIRKHRIGRQVCNPWLYCRHFSCYWLFRHIYVENAFLLVCTWSARVTCMNDCTCNHQTVHIWLTCKNTL